MLYNSPWFKKASAYARRDFDRWFILSAEFGLLEPYEKISPHEVTMGDLPREEREMWALAVAGELREQLSARSKITILAGERYREFLVPLLTQAGHQVHLPAEKMRTGEQLTWLTRLVGELPDGPEPHPDRERLYFLLSALKERQGGLRTLERGWQELDWPQKGVYFFFEPGEFRHESLEQRVVYVGSNCMDPDGMIPLKEHLEKIRGNVAGRGDHRDAELRKHVGFALVNRGDLEKPPLSWGITSTRNRGQISAEDPLERLVSRHIRRMPVLCLSVDKDTGNELCGKIVNGAVSLLSKANAAGDPPGNRWLGQHHPNTAIKLSGLWHATDHSAADGPDFLDCFEELLDQRASK